MYHIVIMLMGCWVSMLVPFAIVHVTAITMEEQVSMWEVRETLAIAQEYLGHIALILPF